MSLRVLFLTCHLPYPPLSGGRRREFELLRRIGTQLDVRLCAISKTLDEDLQNANALADFCTRVHVVPAEPLRTTESQVPFQVLRHRSRHVARALSRTDYDLVHVEGFYLMQHLRGLANRPTVLVEQNIEYQLWEQRAAHSSGRLAWRHRREAERTRRAERTAWHRADGVGALTPEDRRVIQAAGVEQVHLVPDGVEPVAGAARTPADAPAIVTYIGNFAYEPNVDAALYFAKDVFPHVVRAVPDARLLLVGNEPPRQVQALADRSVVVTGRVPDVSPYLREATVVVCPLRIGGGVKVKMLEALAHGKAVVSTSIGIQGLSAAADGAVVVTDDAGAMAAQVAELLGDYQRRHALEGAAQRYASSLPTWDDAAAALLDCYESVAAGRQRLDV